MKMSKRMKLLVRRIQYWLRKHEYQSGYSGLKLYRCFEENYALCRSGVVDSWGGGAVIDRWTAHSIPELRKLFGLAKKQQKLDEEARSK
jgi:hypothetical protein